MLSFLPNFKFLLKTLAISVPAGVTIIDVIGYIAKVEGCSMQPALNPNTSAVSSDYVFLHNWPIVTNSYEDIERGDIVTLVSPRDPRQRIIKRVIALSGDIVETRGYKQSFVRVPAGHCWVEGDHHGNSLDSNLFGPVALGLIKSKAKCIVWPPHRWQMLTKSSSSVFPNNPPPVLLAPAPSYSDKELDLDSFDLRSKLPASETVPAGNLVRISDE